MYCAKGDYPHVQYAFCLHALDAWRAVKCGMASVTWCDVTAIHRRSAWRRLLLLRQRGVRLDVGIRCRNHTIDTRRAVNSGIAAVTWCDVTANHRCAAHSLSLIHI